MDTMIFHKNGSATPDRESPARPAAPVQRPQDIPYALDIGAAWSWRVLLLMAGIWALVKISGPVSTILVSVLVAAILAGLLYPAVAWLRSKKVGGGLATAAVEIGFIVAVLGLLALVGRQLVLGITDLSDQVTSGWQKLMDWLSQGPLNLSVDQLDQAVSSLGNTMKQHSSTIMNGAVSVGSTAGNIGTGVLITLFSLIFFLHEGERIWLFLVGLFPRAARQAVNGAGRRGWGSLVSYSRVQVFVAFIDAVGIGLSAFFLHVPLAMPLAVLVFLASFIPIAGALATGAMAVLLAFVANGPVNALIMLLMVLVVQQIESNILQPLVMGKAVSLHPLAVVLAVAVGSTIMGVVGALFAVPVMAVLNAVVGYLSRREWETDTNLRTEPFQFDWEREKAQQKAARKKDKGGRGAEEHQDPANAVSATSPENTSAQGASAHGSSTSTDKD